MPEPKVKSGPWGQGLGFSARSSHDDVVGYLSLKPLQT